MIYGASAGNSLGASNTGIGAERPAPGQVRLFSTWPVRQALADI